MKIRKVKDLIKQILEANPRMRNSDNLLLSYIWRYESQNKDFFMMLEEGLLTPSESITRARRWVQEHYPHLRGNTYKKRQQEQSQVMIDLGYKSPKLPHN